MKYLGHLILFLVLNVGASFSQSVIPVQKIKGEIRNSANQQTVIGATVVLFDQKIKKGIRSNSKGSFKFDSIPVGRYSLKISSIGFETQIQNIILTSGKELILKIELNESYVLANAIEVTASKEKFLPINEANIVSFTQFNLDDVERFAGSRGDPARMAQNFAGVLGVSNLRNDIIIRGGSPTELLWRLDGLDLPNPNHFGTQGATGGPVGQINSGLLNNSDFVTGGFPSEYGDKMSGVFDLRTRNGNEEKYEYLAQISYNGAELGVEGPLQFAKGSFIANYRYSFLDLFKEIGMDLGIVGVPRYQDGMIKMHFIPDEKNQINITALYGRDNIFMQRDNLSDVVTGDWNLKSGNNNFAIGLTWQYLFSDNLFGKLLIGTVNDKYNTNIDSISCDQNDIHKVISLDKWFSQNSMEGYSNLKYNLFYTPYTNHWITFGLEGRYKVYELDEKRYSAGWGDYSNWDLNKIGNTLQTLSFINWNWKISPKFTSNLGLHSQYLKISNKYTLEPRLALSWNFTDGQFLNLALGIHRQSLPLLLYFSSNINNSLDFMESKHLVLGYSNRLSENMIFKAETYYKDISKVPVSIGVSDYWSFLNIGTNFGSIGGKENLISNGTGKCFGAEFSLIKHFSDGYYLTTTASYVRQKYKGSDGIERYGGFDNIYIINLLAGYEWKISDIFTIEFSGKYTLAGGAPFTPIDTITSRAYNQTYYLTSQPFSIRKPDYKRFDIKIDFRTNFEKVSIIGYVSIENLFNIKNVLEYQWSNSKQKIESVYQLGIFPLGGVRFEF
ncbi:MAG: TonB-dependent receptor [Candidatus Kapabacteria bacterium]|nr:TonB-dependent receptor [Candidatus Kapabacteria bacterium]